MSGTAVEYTVPDDLARIAAQVEFGQHFRLRHGKPP